VTSEKRTPQAPDLPTMIESGLPGFAAGTWFGFQAPAKTPEVIVDSINTALNKVLQGRELSARFASQGADPIGGTRRQFADHINAELSRWASVVKAARIAPK